MSVFATGRRRLAFSLVELLVVIGIIGVMVGLLTAATMKVRAAAERTQCISNLRQLGFAFQSYRDTAEGRFPRAARLPSAAPELPSITKALAGHVDGRHLFRCPSDATYFEREGVSYEYPGEFRGGLTLEQLQAQGRGSDHIWLLYDFDCCHGPRGSGGSRNFLYADGHVSQ